MLHSMQAIALVAASWPAIPLKRWLLQRDDSVIVPILLLIVAYGLLGLFWARRGRLSSFFRSLRNLYTARSAAGPAGDGENSPPK